MPTYILCRIEGPTSVPPRDVMRAVQATVVEKIGPDAAALSITTSAVPRSVEARFQHILNHDN